MMKQVKLAEFIRTVLVVALHSRGDLISAKAICVELELPVRRLEPILQALVKYHMLRATKGPKGGYCLAKERRKITLADIAQIIIDESDQDAATVYCGVVSDYMLELNKVMLDTMKNTTIDDLCNQVSNLTNSNEKQDFAI